MFVQVLSNNPPLPNYFPSPRHARKLSLRVLSNRKKKGRKKNREKQRSRKKGQQKLDERALVTIAAKSGSTARNATCVPVCVCVTLANRYLSSDRPRRARNKREISTVLRLFPPRFIGNTSGPAQRTGVFLCLLFLLAFGPLSRRPATGVIGVVDRGCARNPVAIRDSLRFATVKRQSNSFSLLCSLRNVAAGVENLKFESRKCRSLNTC